MPVKSVYVGNLPYNATEEDVRQLFAQWGPVEQVRLVSEKGFAFVDLPAEKVSDAIRAVNGQSMGGRAVRVDEARPRAPREGGSRPSSGGGYRPSTDGGYRPAGGYRPSEESGGDSRGGSRAGGRDRDRDRNRDRGRDRRRDYSDW